jgi:hypothetical protein
MYQNKLSENKEFTHLKKSSGNLSDAPAETHCTGKEGCRSFACQTQEEQIRDALRALADDPYRGISLKGRWEGYKRLRSGDQRIIWGNRMRAIFVE